jgi:hypothetical protein
MDPLLTDRLFLCFYNIHKFPPEVILNLYHTLSLLIHLFLKVCYAEVLFLLPTLIRLAYANAHTLPGVLSNTNTSGIHTLGRRLAWVKVDVEVN